MKRCGSSGARSPNSLRPEGGELVASALENVGKVD